MIFQTIPNADNGEVAQMIVTPEPGEARPELTEAERLAGRESEGLAKAKEQAGIRDAIAAKRVQQVQHELDSWDVMTAPEGDVVPAESRRVERSEDGRPTQPVSRRSVLREPVPAPPVMHHLDLGGGAVIPVNDEQMMHLARQGAVRVIAAHQQPQQQQHYQPPPRHQRPVQQQQPAYRQVPAQPIIEERRARDIAKRIAYGNEDEATRAVAELGEAVATRARGPAIDPNAIARQASQHIIAQARFENNLQTVAREYPEIFNDRPRTQMAIVQLMELRDRDKALGVKRPELDEYREACQMVRGMFGGGARTAPDARRASPVPRTRHGSSSLDMRTLDTPPPRSVFIDDSRREAVLAMKRARGQAF